LINALLRQGYPAIDDVARLLCISPRTLQRQLNEAGASYSELVNHCRCQAACEHLRQTRDPVQDIAAILGYRDTSSFSRAFRRWTGSAPLAWRNRLTGRDVITVQQIGAIWQSFITLILRSLDSHQYTVLY
jgi:AraC-like DNA-binding protein